MGRIDAATRMPAELVTLVDELVKNAVLLGLAGGGVHTDEYSILTYQRKFLYEYLELNLLWDEEAPMTTLRFY